MRLIVNSGGLPAVFVAGLTLSLFKSIKDICGKA